MEALQLGVWCRPMLRCWKVEIPCVEICIVEEIHVSGATWYAAAWNPILRTLMCPETCLAHLEDFRGLVVYFRRVSCGSVLYVGDGTSPGYLS